MFSPQIYIGFHLSSKQNPHFEVLLQSLAACWLPSQPSPLSAPFPQRERTNKCRRCRKPLGTRRNVWINWASARPRYCCLAPGEGTARGDIASRATNTFWGTRRAERGASCSAQFSLVLQLLNADPSQRKPRTF